MNLSTWHELGTKRKFRVPNRNLTHNLLHCVIYNSCLFEFLSRTTASNVGFSYYFTFCSSISLLLLGNAWHNLPWYMYCVLMLLPVLIVVTSLVALFSGKCYYMLLCWYIKLLYFCSEVIGQWREAQWPNGQCVRSRSERSGFKLWPGTLCCVLGQDTSLSRCLSPPRSINGYRQFVGET